MEEYDLAVLDREAHSRGAAGTCQRSKNCSDRFGTMRVVDDSHPFFEFAVFVPGRVLKLAETAAGNACIQFRCGSIRT
jgi:hypothetical protein